MCLFLWIQEIRLRYMYCKFGNFRENLYSRKFANAEFCEDKTLVKLRNFFVVYFYYNSQILSVENISFNAMCA